VESNATNTSKEERDANVSNKEEVNQVNNNRGNSGSDKEFTICNCNYKIIKENLVEHKSKMLHAALLDVGNTTILDNTMSFPCPLCNTNIDSFSFGYHYKNNHKKSLKCIPIQKPKTVVAVNFTKIKKPLN
jgi:hypothetical protein